MVLWTIARAEWCFFQGRRSSHGTYSIKHDPPHHAWNSPLVLYRGEVVHSCTEALFECILHTIFGLKDTRLDQYLNWIIMNTKKANGTVMQSKRKEWGSIGYSFLPCAPVCCDSINSAMLHFHQGLFMLPGRIKEHEHTQMCSHSK